MRLKGKTAVITGGGTGIGRATSLLFAGEGASAVVTDIDEDSGLRTVKEIIELGGQALFVKHDVRSETDWEEVAAQTANIYGKADILFNNAGLFLIKPLLETTLADWERLMSVNVTGVFLGMKHIIPLMLAGGKGGSIINASSNAGLFGASGLTLYGATKGAVRIMSKDAALEFASANIRVNSIHPGYIHTQMIDYAAELASKKVEDQGALVPLGKVGSTLDVARLALYLASDESSYATGAEFVLDGGVSAGPPDVWKQK
ncbi:SDR family NAD(P)-dependent oxidoreductase [Paenibacillus sp. Leaf72]|uniref:SDR family NAD(P)-dependent oxidoreductase n=1 Tax=Paenibacillus sp. Leaf72 TaxID=1736234 RepID=UPI0006FAAFCB|nr:glucose 1-dehydrogenase [Paenibacillus sp. Leaf72]KQO17790.1 short-chain dehydrogenase [Paenibacillus sp. Leaf72]